MNPNIDSSMGYLIRHLPYGHYLKFENGDQISLESKLAQSYQKERRRNYQQTKKSAKSNLPIIIAASMGYFSPDIFNSVSDLSQTQEYFLRFFGATTGGSFSVLFYQIPKLIFCDKVLKPAITRMAYLEKGVHSSKIKEILIKENKYWKIIKDFQNYN